MPRSPVPDAGDIVWMNFTSQAGHEHSGLRPAVVLSPAVYNGKTGLAICCPMTTRVKGYPFEVIVDSAAPSAVLADQVKCLDWRARGAVRRGRVTQPVLDEVRAKLRALIG